MKVICSVLFALAPVTSASALPEAIEIGIHNVDQLPGGREADGIIGDFVLRNDRIEVVVSGNMPNRKANMTVFWEGPTPGCIYDLCPRGSHNDQLTYFAPGRHIGALSSMRILKTGEDGEAIIRGELTPTGGDGLGKTMDYILRDGWGYVLAVSTYRNETKQPRKIRAAADWKGLVDQQTIDGITVALCQDPADRIGYAFTDVTWEGSSPALEEVEIPPGQTKHFATALAVGNGTAEPFGILKNLRGEKTRPIRGHILDTKDHPAAAARLVFDLKAGHLVGFVAPDGRYELILPTEMRELTVKDMGRPDQKVSLGDSEQLDIRVPPVSGVVFHVADEQNALLPCKVQFIGDEKAGTKSPDLGPIIRAHGCDNQYQSETGEFTTSLPAGKYHLVVTRGIEYDHAERDIDLTEGTLAPFDVKLHRIVDTTGWISADFHNHSTPSGDNYCGTDDRVINLAAEHIEFAPTTEHNRIYDWQPHIDKLGLHNFVATVQGIELTGNGPHLNSFPLKMEPYRQDNGAPEWDRDPRIDALMLRRLPGDTANRWVQLNHPNIAKYFNDLDGDGKPDGGFKLLEAFIDATEAYGDTILSGQPSRTYHYQGKDIVRENAPFAWLQMLNAGRRIWTVAVSDAHQVTQGGVGGWRTYIRSSQDEPAKFDYKEIIANAKAGHSFVTTGPFLEVSTTDHHGPGDTIITKDPVKLHVRVQCNTWTDIDRVAVLVNGRTDPKLDFRRSTHPEMFKDSTVRFDQELTVTLPGDAHLIIVAIGEGTNLEKGYGRSWQRELHPVAYNNPIYIDVDGNGFQPNHDTLDHPFLGIQQQNE